MARGRPRKQRPAGPTQRQTRSTAGGDGEIQTVLPNGALQTQFQAQPSGRYSFICEITVGLSYLTVFTGHIGVLEPRTMPVESAVHSEIRQEASNPHPQPRVTNQDLIRSQGTVINTITPRMPARPNHPSSDHMQDLHVVDAIRPPMHQSGLYDPGLGSSDPFIHVHFPPNHSGTQSLAHVQTTFVLQTPHRFGVPTTPVRSRVQLADRSPSTAATIRRGLAAIIESSDDDAGNLENSPPRRKAPQRKAKADDVWTFFRFDLQDKERFCTFCE